MRPIPEYSPKYPFAIQVYFLHCLASGCSDPAGSDWTISDKKTKANLLVTMRQPLTQEKTATWYLKLLFGFGRCRLLFFVFRGMPAIFPSIKCVLILKHRDFWIVKNFRRIFHSKWHRRLGMQIALPYLFKIHPKSQVHLHLCVRKEHLIDTGPVLAGGWHETSSCVLLEQFSFLSSILHWWLLWSSGSSRSSSHARQLPFRRRLYIS